MKRTALLAAIFVLLIATVAVCERSQHPLIAGLGANVRVLYCGGSLLARGGDPYGVDAIRQCAHRIAPGSAVSDRNAYPSRLPAYALVAFALLSRLPYAIAKPLWLGLLLGAVFAAAAYLAALTRVRVPLVLLAMSLSAAYLSLVDGLLAPFVLLALSAAAYYCERRRYVSAALALAATMIEPQVGLVVCLSAALWLPRVRVALSLAVGALVVGGVVALGVARSAAYALHVVPARAFAELVAVDQWSLAHVLHIFGLPDGTAMWLGVVSYGAMAAIGIVFARRAARALDCDGLIVALPAAAVLLGGPYLHEQQLSAAFPAAFLLASRATYGRSIAWLALGLLVFPWFSLADKNVAVFLPAFMVALIAIGGLTFVAARGLSPLSRGLTMAGALVGCSILVLLFRHLPGPVAAPVAQASAQHGFAVTSDWRALSRAEPELSVVSWQKEAEKLPSWIALVSLVSVSGMQRRDRVRNTRRERQRRQEIAISV